jgi:hypothetical protein
MRVFAAQLFLPDITFAYVLLVLLREGGLPTIHIVSYTAAEDRLQRSC